MVALASVERFDGWRIVALAAFAQGLALPLLGAFGLLATPLIEEFGASTTQLGIGMSLAILATALAGPALGFALDRGPLRTIMLSGVALMWVSVLLLSRGTALWQLGACLAFATVGMSMYGMLPVQVILVNWFVLRRGAALSLAFVGTSVAAFVIPPTTAWGIEWLGWRGALVALASAAALLATPVITRLVKRPEELGQHPDGIPAEPRAERAARAATPASEARSEPKASVGMGRDRNFWLIAIGVGLALSVSIATLFLVRHIETLGIPRTQAALVPSAMALFGIAGKLGAGWLIDRLDARAVVGGALALHALGWAIVASQSTYAAMLIAAAPLGLGGGGFLPLPPVLQGRCFGRAAIGRVGGLQALIGLPFLLAAAPLVGWVESRTGSFAGPFFGLMVVLVLAAGAFALLRIPEVEPD
jgi:sugar phosphate permease